MSLLGEWKSGDHGNSDHCGNRSKVPEETDIPDINVMLGRQAPGCASRDTVGLHDAARHRMQRNPDGKQPHNGTVHVLRGIQTCQPWSRKHRATPGQCAHDGPTQAGKICGDSV